jgi:hypothetical protein
MAGSWFQKNQKNTAGKSGPKKSTQYGGKLVPKKSNK